MSMPMFSDLRVPATKKLIRQLAAACTLCAVSACAHDQHYHRPEPLSSQPFSAPEGFKLAQPADELPREAWWRSFHDAELDHLIEVALAGNQNLAASLARLDAARAQAQVASANLYPAIGLQGGATRSKTSANRPLAAYGSTNQSTVQDSFLLAFNASYELDLFGRVRDSAKLARINAEQAAADTENLRLVMLAELCADYFNLRELDAEADIVRTSIAGQERALTLIRERHALGIASGLELAQQQSVLDNNRTQLDLLQVQRHQFEHALATLTGTPANEFSLAPKPQTSKLPAIAPGTPASLLERRPDIASAERAVEAANTSIGIARAGYFPILSLQSSGGWNSNSLSQLLNAPSLLWSLGSAITQTVLDGGRTESAVAAANAGYRATVATYRQTVLTALQDVENGLSDQAWLELAARDADQSIKSATAVYDITQERYHGGVDTYLNVVNAQQALLSNQRQAAQIQGRRLIATVALIKALGGGWQGLPDPAQQN